jgi:hypothetical protein
MTNLLGRAGHDATQYNGPGLLRLLTAGYGPKASAATSAPAPLLGEK